MRALHVVVVLAMLAPSMARILCGFDCMRPHAQTTASCHAETADEQGRTSVGAFETADCHPQDPLPVSVGSVSTDVLATATPATQPFGPMRVAPYAAIVPAWTVKPPGVHAAVPLRI